ncbi:hypothetical protein NMU03_01920 [Allocoprobacillus halotolerans]|uniref:Lipoprotein n=1 Tax=Allocoprobacillus halotolerans TaxID=2944914 RepID=A0ABY5I2L7_9FIRM|nr:hypothetical protein [Allocoprobacillus halotolerans]UTY39612.1 hypothetical protein NMU03_01920 [Allocoprobacillus halotolerans]
MGKQKRKFIILLCIIYLFGTACGYITSRISQSNNTLEFVDVQKNELSIYYDFFDIDDLVYVKDHLNTKIYLNEKGDLYNRTNLFLQNYKVNISLINNQSDEIYVVFDEIDWNINETLNINLKINEEEIKDKSKLSDLEKQLEKMENNQTHEIMYCVEVVPENNSQNIMRTIGMLNTK